MGTIQIIISVILSLCVLAGISMMSKVKSAVNGNLLSALALFLGIVETLVFYDVIGVWTVYGALIIGALIGGSMAKRVQMIQMPQVVALFNGLGGGASALVGVLSAFGVGVGETEFPGFVNCTSILAIAVGMITLVGSLVAAGKLHRVISQKSMVWPAHSAMTLLFFILTVAFIVMGAVAEPEQMLTYVVGCMFTSSLFGLYFSVRVGGADMPITISLLNSLSGVAGAIAGMAISDIFLVAVGGIVGASGLLLTQIMCRAMNRSLLNILLGGKVKKSAAVAAAPVAAPAKKQEAPAPKKAEVKKTPASVLANAKDVIIVPGYGMALAQAQHLVKQLADTLEGRGARVRFAIHPVAGRMPGHMNVLLAEADVPYEKLFEMEAINDDFKNADAVVVIGANDVTNPAARSAEGTPIYGMPVLSVDDCKEVIICNFDLKPGFAGVENPIYSRKEGVYLELGDAKKTLQTILAGINTASAASAPATEAPKTEKTPGSVLATAKDVIIVPGYGMALAQAQHLVKQLADTLEGRGARVRFAIHPVAGRMPGHMNVLLAEADVPYEKLYEMDAINDDFKKADAVVVIGANDVTNPAARSAEGTPIYGMPVLNVDDCKEVIICNFDLKPGFAGVDNPIYSRKEGVYLELGDAKKTLQSILAGINTASTATEAKAEAPKAEKTPGSVLAAAKDVIIVPGYGMALAQAQHLVKQLADTLEGRGTNVRFAIHPVAGRMPGHMNVLLAEADVPYEKLYEMDAINDDFKKADAVVVIGANDVTNPAARSAEGTPIYGMPVLNVDDCKEVIICNFDLKPGFAGVDNPIYSREEGVFLKLGDAKKTLQEILAGINTASAEPATVEEAPKAEKTPGSVLADAKEVIIVPGYGMALAQAQHLVKQLADTLEGRGTNVRFAIHPVAGRMPGHMNVLLAEADVPYEKLYEMDAINDDFKNADAVVVIGANDVTNPAARSAEGTPIYGMPVLNVDDCKEVIICNYDLKPGFAGVENPIYSRENGVYLRLGDAKKSLQDILAEINTASTQTAAAPAAEEKKTPSKVLSDAKNVIIVPGYGMALAQAQHLVKQLADTLESRGTEVRFAIHPVAGRMPGHMNVLLAEADVPYEKLYEMDAINDDFKNADAVVVIGANDVTNPAARSAEGTPIYGMPVLNVEDCKEVIICNYDLKPGFAGVENPIYSREEGVYLELGDAKKSLQEIINKIG